jgi:hypothetical protein
VTGKNDIGGLVGKGSIIDNSYSTGAVTGEKNVGGLMGFSEWASEISNSYSIGTVTGESNIGGLVGNNYNEWGGIISNSYSIGTVTGENNVGGLVGNNIRIFSSGSVSYGEISNSYYDSQISNQSDTNKGEGKTTAEMKQQSTFVNWDFNDIWDINNTVNNGYPYLVNIMAPQ